MAGELERACRAVATETGPVAGGGRTDAGVHAAGQVARVELTWRKGPAELLRALNANLPRDVAVVDAREAAAAFDPRRDAASRAYRYAILRREARSPLLHRWAWWINRPLALPAMRAAAAAFRGLHDFSAFCTAEARARGAVRRLDRCALAVRGPLLLLDVRGGGFLHRMVRLIAGAVVGAGTGALTPARIRRALSGGETRPIADAAPPQGLCLLRIAYPDDRPGPLPAWPPGGLQ